MDYKRSHSLSSCSSNNSNLQNGNLILTNGSNSSTNSTNELSNSISSNNLSFSLINQSHHLNVTKSPSNLIQTNFENQTNTELILLSNSQFNSGNDEQIETNFIANENELNGHPLYPHHSIQTQHIPTTQIIAHPNQQLIHDAQLNNAAFNSNHYLNNNCTIYELSNVN